MEGVANLCWWLITHREEQRGLSDDLLSDAAYRASKILTIGLTAVVGNLPRQRMADSGPL